MRKFQFTNGEVYHVFNRGTDKREIFSDEEDLYRFFQSMEEFNVVDPIGSIYENSFRDNQNKRGTWRFNRQVGEISGIHLLLFKPESLSFAFEASCR